MREWLRKIRLEKGFSQKYVATQSFIDRTYYSQIEKGTRTPSFDAAKNIAATMDFNSSMFFMEHFSEPFETALKHAPIIIAHCDLNLRYTWLFNPHPDFDPHTSIGKRDDELAVNSGTIALMDLKRKVIEEDTVVKLNISFPLSDGTHTYYVFGEPLRNNNGEIIGAVTASTDISNIPL